MTAATRTPLSTALSTAGLSIVPTTHPSTSRVSSSCVVATQSGVGVGGGVGGTGGDEVQYKTTGYYADSSGRARIKLALRLNFADENEIDAVVASGCLVPPPPSPSPSSSSATAEDEGGDNNEDEGDGGDESNKKKPKKSSRTKKNAASLRFECSPSIPDDGYSSHLSVEAITVLSTHVDKSDPDGCAVLFEVELCVRSSAHSDDDDEENENDDGMKNGHGGSSRGANDTCNGGGGGVLQIRAVLSERVPSGGGGPTKQTITPVNKVPLGLLALELGGGVGGAASGLASSAATATPSKVHYSTLQTRTKPVQLNLKLVEPLSVTIREVGGARAASGATLVSVTVAHSNLHDEDVTVTNLAIHPGHSRPWDSQQAAAAASADASVAGRSNKSPISRGAQPQQPQDDGYSSPSGSHLHNTSILAGPNSVLDMSTSVRWGYAPGTAPSLPLVLKPRESIATVLQIDAGENLRTRAYISPVAVTAVVGGGRNEVGDKVDAEGATAASESDRRKALTVPSPVPIMVSTDARWTTARLAVEPADAFRVDLSLTGSGSTCRVGAPVVVGLRVMNLSSEAKDLMLLMAKDEESSRDKDGGGLGYGGFSRRHRDRYVNSNASVSGAASVVTSASTPLIGGRPMTAQSSHHGVNTAVVSEVNGYTFGVWGLSGDDDGTARHNRDHELLAVDAALLLGEVKGQHAIEAELRFVPLREGTLDVPNLKLYDKLGGRWYNCVHLLKIVAKAANRS